MPFSIVLLVLKATLLLVIALGTALALHRASAGARHLVWLVALGALLALPLMARLVAVPLHVLPTAVTREATEVAHTTAPVGAAPATSAAPSDASRPATPAATETTDRLPRWLPRTLTGVLLSVWLAIAIALLVQLGLGAIAVRRIVRRAQPLSGPDWQEPLYQIADRLGLDDAPRLVRSSDVMMPFAAGLLTPTIVLPAESDAWTADRRSAVLIHELAHVRRRDLVGHTLGRLACAAYWFHPMVWSAARRLRAESERACDDLALLFGARPSEYAEHLLEIVSSVRDHRTPSIALAMAHRKEFEGRMLAILNPELRRQGPGRLQSVALVGGLAVVAVAVSAAAPVARRVPDGRLAAQPAATRDTTTLAPTPTASASNKPVPATPAVQRIMTMIDEGTPGGPATGDRVAVLAQALRSDTSAMVRRVAAWGLERFAEEAAAAQALASAVTTDADAGVREMAAWALWGSKTTPAVTAALGKASKDAQLPVRNSAVWSLGYVADEAAVPLLVAALTDADEHVRELAAWGIGNVAPAKAPAGLLAALGDRSYDVRTSVAWALFNIRDTAAVRPLSAALQKETDPDLQYSLIRAIGASAEGAVDVLEGLVTSPNAEVRSAAAKALAGVHDGSPWPWPRPRPRPSP